MSPFLAIGVLFVGAAIELQFIRHRLNHQVGERQLTAEAAAKVFRYHYTGWAGLALIFAVFGFGRLFNLL